MTVLERMVAAGFDPAKVMEWRGNGSVECDEIEVRMSRCIPKPFTDAIMVIGCGCHPFTDGTVRPAPSWYGDEVVMLFDAATAPFEFKGYRVRY